MENWAYTSNPKKECLTLRNRSATESNELFHFEKSGLFKCQSLHTMSDSRHRQDIKNLDEQTIDNLKPVSFFNTLTKNNEMGFEADNVKKSFCDLVDDCSFVGQSINYNGITAVLVKEVKDLKHRINNLEGTSTPNSVKSVVLSYDDKYFSKEDAKLPDVIPVGPTGPNSIFFTKPASFIKKASVSNVLSGPTGELGPTGSSN